MRILMITQYFPPETGAAQVRLKEVAKALQAQGHQVQVVTAFPNHLMGVIPQEYRGKFFMRDEYEGIPLLRTWVYPVPRGRFWKRLLNYFSFVFSACYGVIKADPTDVIFVESPPLFIGFTALFARGVKRVPLILNISDLWPESAVSLGLVTNKRLIAWAEHFELYLYRKAWKISAQTQGILTNLRNRGIPDEKFVFLPNGVDPKLFYKQEPDKEIVKLLDLEGKFVILYAGTMGYAHGVEVVAGAAEKLKEDKVVFLFVGDGSERPKLEEMAKERKLTGFRFVDFQPITEMHRYYSVAQASLSTLRRYKLAEGVRPSKIFPAMASEKPLIYVGEGEGAEIAQASGGALVLPPEDPEALAEAVRKLMQDPDFCERLARHGREYVVKYYSWESIVEAWLKSITLATKETHKA
ncbi:MAG: glycosyltransferase family 4 protein [Desulfosporosinus sp.]